ncbi:hypothetical protein DFP72DRAFT_1076638 [Ephemerocybe angulata]|uniref:Uncharacterized protein n=1 Tax=Ephemerocybe angulata TaxID=980116 RepID=A0A8H6HGN6_9AGAR|nr:hypothetical protein DFP72DRAFT_1076638 [Tulosesus angulatus]
MPPSCLHIDSIEKLLTTSSSLINPTPSVADLSFEEIIISLAHEPSDATTSSTTINALNEIPFLFLLNIRAIESVTIELIIPVPSVYLFPWHAISKWADLSALSITAALPNVATLAFGLVALPNLNSLKLDVEYLEPSNSGQPLPRHPSTHLTLLEVGFRGFAIFHWLATSRARETSIGTLALKIDEEDILPLMDYVVRHPGATQYLSISLYHRRYIHVLASCLMHFTQVLEIELYLKYLPTRGYKGCLQAICSAIRSRDLEMLTVYVPELPKGFREERKLLQLAESCLLQTQLEVVGKGREEESEEEDGYAPCVASCQRSWM